MRFCQNAARPGHYFLKCKSTHIFCGFYLILFNGEYKQVYTLFTRKSSNFFHLIFLGNKKHAQTYKVGDKTVSRPRLGFCKAFHRGSSTLQAHYVMHSVRKNCRAYGAPPSTLVKMFEFARFFELSLFQSKKNIRTTFKNTISYGI